MLETLTAEQEAMLDSFAAAYITDCLSPKELDMQAIGRWLDVVYGLYDRKPPERVEVMSSPEAALKLATELTGQPQTAMDWCGVSDAGWVSFYDYLLSIGVLDTKEEGDLIALRDFLRCAWDSVLLDDCAIVVRRPIAIRVDDGGNLHAAGAPAIEWLDGEKDYAWHGTWVPERVIMDPRSHTIEEYRAISNTEIRRALGESAGWQWVADLLGAKTISKWTDRVTKLRYELLQCADGQKMLRKQSPRLKTGKRPTYVEPVHEDLQTARAARKWQAVPSMTPAQCEADPVLKYGTEA